MISEEDEASDAGALGLRTPVAEESAKDQETTNDDSGMIQVNDLDYEIMVPLASATIGCRVCANLGYALEFLSLRSLADHLEEQHSQIRALWKCRRCNKSFGRLHGVQCHLPKCKSRFVELSEYKCAMCTDSFDTAVGLSMHERHKHPEERNRKRKEAAERPGGKPGRVLSVWTEDEVAKLQELNDRFKHEKYPNVRIQEFLPDKTLRQISDRRRALPKAIHREAQVEEAPEPNENPDIGEMLNMVAEISGTNLQIDIEADEDWIIDLRNAITQMKCENEDFKEIDDRLNKTTEKEHLDEIIHLLKIILTKENESKDITGNNKTHINSNNKVNKYIQEKGKRLRTKNKYKNQLSHNCRAKYSYARCQELYNKCPQKLIDVAISGEGISFQKSDPPAAEDIRNLYTALWGSKASEITLPDAAMEYADIKSIFAPITVQEIIDRMKRIKSNTAAGLDGIRKVHLRKVGALVIIAKLYNLLLAFKYYPLEWRKNRTTLIPKAGKDCADVRNLRPITIGSIIGRIFSGILDARLRMFITQSIRQKGFTAEDGCKANINLFAGALARMKSSTGGVVTVVDISKAFDTIPHSMLKSCMLRKGVPISVAEFIRKMYENCKTIIRARGGQEVEIELKRGVKQGDPLSPLLFNLVLDPIIEELERNTEGIIIQEENVAVLAFADDMILIGKDKEIAKTQLRMLDTYLNSLGMSLSIGKCSTFEIKTKDKTWYLKDPQIQTRDGLIPCSKPEEIIAYLGARVTPWKGFLKGADIPTITKAINNIKRMKLKPHQKIDLIRIYLLPKFIHGLVASPPPIWMLEYIDDEVRRTIKQILHLHPSTTDGILYTSKSYGGLGIPRVENIVKLAAIRSAIKMLESNDGALKEAIRELDGRYVRYATSIGIRWPSTLEEVESARIKLKRQETERWSQLRSQGQGVADFSKDLIGNAWLYNPTLLKPSRFLDALKLRTNTFGTRIVLRRANQQISTQCRRCNAELETLGHILGICTHTKPQRIRRHDEIKNFLADKLTKNCTVFKEPTIRVSNELKKPDLVIKDQEKLIVVDVTVRYEDRSNLKNAFKEKENKYKETAEYIKSKIGCSSAEVLPIVVGSRGAIPNQTRLNLKKLKFNKQEMITISMIALRSSLEMANAFIDYDRII